MLFFKRKKKGKEPPIPKFEFSLQQKENLIEYVIFRNQVSEKSRYQTVFLEILDTLIQDACVFLDRSTMKEDVFSNFMKKKKKKGDGSYLFDEDRNVIEKGRGIFSILSEESFFAEENGVEKKDFILYCYPETVPLQDTIQKQRAFFEETGLYIKAWYEDGNTEKQTLHIWIKNDLFSIEELIHLSIDTCKQHGKNIELRYQE